MARRVKVFEIFIASPADARQERDIVCELVADWNAIHYRSSSILMHAIRWESHSYPQLGDRAQSIINKKLLLNADLVVAIFKGRLGQETGKYQSGTIEEIEEARSAKIPVLLYFSVEPPIKPRGTVARFIYGGEEPQAYLVKRAEFDVVQRLRAHYERQGIIGAYPDIQEFETLLRQQLYHAISELISADE
jgi:hypothetical protein